MRPRAFQLGSSVKSPLVTWLRDESLDSRLVGYRSVSDDQSFQLKSKYIFVTRWIPFT